MIKAIVFDYGGVIEITNGQQGNLIKSIVDYLNIDLDKWLKTYLSLNYFSNIEGKSYEETYALTAKKLGANELQIEHMIKMMAEDKQSLRLNLGLIEIIKNLKNNGYKIGLISNNISNFRKELENNNLINLFDSIVISSEVKCQKPNKEIFDISFKDLGVKSNEVIFIDDSISALAKAKDVGYYPILFKNNQDLIEKLQELKINL